MPSPRRTIAVVAATAVLAAGGGYVGSRFLVSPAEAAARTAAPPAGPITVPVVKTKLQASVTTRGDVGYTDAADVELPVGAAGAGVVTGRIPEVGDPVIGGSVLVEVAGRPVIVLPGAVPAYRTLTPGAKGPDVRQLQRALTALHRYRGPIDGVYDTEMAAAVAKLYVALGYQPPAAGDEAKAAVQAATDALQAAAAQVTAAQDALGAESKGPKESEKLAAQNAVDTAAAALEKAKVTATPADQSAVDTAQQDLDAAAQTLQAAQSARDKAAADAGQADPAHRAAAQQELARRDTALVAAQQVVDDAKAALDSARTPGPPDQNTIDEAQRNLDLAITQRDEVLAGPDTSAAQASLDTARRARDAAAAKLASAKVAAGTPFPVNEVVYLDDLPRRVDDVKATVGGTAQGVLLTVSGVRLQVTATVSDDEAALLKKGMPATLALPDGKSAGAAVTAITATTDGTGNFTVTLDPKRITKDQAVALRGTNVKVTIGIGASDGAVLTVPVAALFSDAAGNPRVEIQPAAGGVTRFQAVRIGLTAGGNAEVHPVDAKGKDVVEGTDTLADGSLVVVGR